LCIVGAMQLMCSSETDQVNTPTGAGNSGTGNSANAAGFGAGGNGTGGTAAGGGVGNNGTGGTGGWGQGGFEEYYCQSHLYECGNTIDDDGDGLTDWQDPDCLGVCDNTEGSYYGGIPGQNNAPCKMDCYFDQDTGSGNDDCYWDHACDPHSVAPDYYPEPWNGSACAYTGPEFVPHPPGIDCGTLLNANGQTQACLDFCLPLTPNGCDCFGCCELPAESGSFVYLGSLGVNEDTVCTQEEVANPAVCHPCTPVTDCYNGCGHCEICIGKPELPPDCFPPDGGVGGTGAGGTGAGGNPGSQCDPGIQPCGLPGQEPCPTTQYCVTGCCQDIPA
jgi:hypothetical protein